MRGIRDDSRAPRTTRHSTMEGPVLTALVSGIHKCNPRQARSSCARSPFVVFTPLVRMRRHSTEAMPGTSTVVIKAWRVF